jgi:hypothetical protein
MAVNGIPLMTAHLEWIRTVYHKRLRLCQLLTCLYQPVHLVFALVPDDYQCASNAQPL